MLVVLGLSVGQADARGPSAPVTTLQPEPEGQTSAGMLLLRSPTSDAVLIREGTFTMGSSAEEITYARTLCQAEPMATGCAETRFSEEFPDHEVFLSEYWIDRTEVTVAQYRRCVAAGTCLEPPYASGATRFDLPNFPVVMVNWFDATNYCTWAGGRLPRRRNGNARRAASNGGVFPGEIRTTPRW